MLEDDEETITACLYANDDNITDAEIRDEFCDICEDDELERVGSVEIDNDEGWLRYIEVDENYRRMGIGSTLIRLAIKYTELKSIACVKEDEAYEYDLTEDGERLIAYCVEEGIIPANMCYFAHEVPLSEEDASSDPGMSSVMVMNAIPGRNRTHNYNHFVEEGSDYEDDLEYYPGETEPDYLDEDELDDPFEDEPDFLNENVADEDKESYPDDGIPDYVDLGPLNYPGNEAADDDGVGDRLSQGLKNLNVEIEISMPRAPSPLLPPLTFFKQEKENDDLLERTRRRTPSPTNK